jgi:hypothetical protein
MAETNRLPNPIDLIFDVSVPKSRYVVRGLLLADVWWTLAVLGLLAVKPAPVIDQLAAGSLAALIATVLLLPLVENAIYILAVDLAAGHGRARLPVAAVLAALATLLHGSYGLEALFLFGAYFSFAMIYLAWRGIDRSMGFWLGVVLHALLNAPGAVRAFLG